MRVNRTAAKLFTTAERSATQCIIHDEKIVDDKLKMVLSRASVKLPDGTHFDQWVMRIPAAVLVLMVDDSERALTTWRHRFTQDRGGGSCRVATSTMKNCRSPLYVRPRRRPAGGRARSEKFLEFQPLVGTVDQPNIVYLARGATNTGATPDVNETDTVRWIPLDEIEGLIAASDIIGAGSVAPLYKLLLARAEGKLCSV